VPPAHCAMPRPHDSLYRACWLGKRSPFSCRGVSELLDGPRRPWEGGSMKVDACVASPEAAGTPPEARLLLQQLLALFRKLPMRLGKLARLHSAPRRVPGSFRCCSRSLQCRAGGPWGCLRSSQRSSRSSAVAPAPSGAAPAGSRVPPAACSAPPASQAVKRQGAASPSAAPAGGRRPAAAPPRR
jgi:hypothetical protein